MADRGISWSLRLRLVDDASKPLLAFARAQEVAARQASKAANEATAAAKKSADAAAREAKRKADAAAQAAQAAARAAQAEVRAATEAATSRTKEAREAAAAAKQIATAQQRAARLAQQEATAAQRAAGQRETAYNRAAKTAQAAARDEAAAAKQIATAQSRAATDAKRAHDRQRGSIAGAASAMTGYARTAAVVAGAGGIGAVIRAAGNFDTAMREVGAVTNANGRDLRKLSDIARDAGLETGVGASAAAQAMGELAKAGLNTAEIGPALQGTLTLAQAGGIGAADAASAAANAMQTFGLRAKDTGRIADALANAANATTADIGDFAMALTQGGSAAKLAGVSFNDTTLVLAQLAKIGVEGSDAGTSMKSAFLQLAKPTDEARGAMEKYGLSFFDARGKMKDVADIGEMLRSRLGGLTQQQRVSVLQTVAGTDGFRTLAAMMNMSGKETDALERKLQKQGSAAQDARQKNSGFAGAMNRLKASGEELSNVIGAPLVNAISDGANAVSDFIKEARDNGDLEKLGKTVGDAAKKIGELASAAIEFGKAHPGLVKAAAALVGVGVAVKTIRFADAITGVTSLLRGLGRLTGVGISAGRQLGRSLGDELADTAASRGRAGLSASGALTKGGIRGRMGSVGRTLGSLLGVELGQRGASKASSELGKGGAITGKTSGRMRSIGTSLGGVLGKAIGIAAAADIVLKLNNALTDWLDDKALGGTVGDARKQREKAHRGITDPTGTGPESGGPLKWLYNHTIGGGRRGGTAGPRGINRFQSGGLVPALVSSGEALRFPDGSWDTVPGPRVAADNVAAMLPERTEVYTDHGQGLLAAGMTRQQALAEQLPHFAKGGIVEAARAGRRAGLSGSRLVTAVAVAGPESGYRPTARLNNPPIEDSRGLWQINTIAHPWTRGMNLYDPDVNARAMARVSNGGRNWGPWAGYTSGKFRSFITAARRAVLNSRGAKVREGSALASDVSREVTLERALGASTVRGGEVLGEGLEAGLGLDGLTRADIRRYGGNPYLAEVRQALDEAVDSYTRTVTVNASGVRERKPSKATRAGRGRGGISWPTASRQVTSGFGRRSSPGGVGSTNHDGIDIGIPVGTAVRSIAAGRVTRAGVNGGYGNYVSVQHSGGLLSFYGHLSQILTRAGARVAGGQLIARSGNTGTSTGPHLHLGMHRGGQPIDPRTVLGKRRGGLIGRFAKGGVVAPTTGIAKSAPKSKKHRAQLEEAMGIVQGMWPHAAAVLPGASAASMPPTLFGSNDDSIEGLFFGSIIDPSGRRKDRYVSLPWWSMKGLVSGSRAGRAAMAETVIHEWAHHFQSRPLSSRGTPVEVEGGAQAWTRAHATGIMRAAGHGDWRVQSAKSDTYLRYARAARKQFGDDWVERGQFLNGYKPRKPYGRLLEDAKTKKISGFRRGGRVGRFALGGVVAGTGFGTTGAPATKATRSAVSSVLRSASDANLQRLDDVVGALGSSRLNDLTEYLAAQVNRPQSARSRARVEAALKVASGELGRRINQVALNRGRDLEGLSVGVEGVDRRLQLQGIDADSVRGRQAVVDANRQAQRGSMALEDRIMRDQARLTARLREQKVPAEDMAKALAPLDEQLKAAREATKGFGQAAVDAATDLELARPKLEAEARDAQIGMLGALAGLTAGTDDDRHAAMLARDEAARQLNEASRRGDVAWITQAAGDLANAAESLRSIERGSVDDQLDYRQALAELTTDTADDRQVAEERRAEAERRLADAMARGDTKDATAQLQVLKQMKDVLESIDTTAQEQKDRDDALAELLRQTKENQERILVGMATQKDALASALAAAVSGQLGPSLTRSAGTPAYAGGGWRL